MTNAAIEKDLIDSINKNMPQMVGQELVKRLQQADADAAELNLLKAARDGVERERAQLRRQIDEQKVLLEAHAALDVRETAIAARERNAEISELTIKLAAAEKYGADVRTALHGLVRNTVYRESLNGTENLPFTYSNNGGPSTSYNSLPVTKSEERTAE